MTRVYVYSSALVAFVTGTSIIYPAQAAVSGPYDDVIIVQSRDTSSTYGQSITGCDGELTML